MLARAGDDAPVANHRGGVVAPSFEQLREPHHRRDAPHAGREALELAPAVEEETFPQQQVFRRIAAQRKFGREHQVGPRGTRLLDGLEDPGCVAGEVAYGAVDLRKRDADALAGG